MPTSSPVCPASAWAVSSMKWTSNPAAPTVRSTWTTSWRPASWPAWKTSPCPGGPIWAPRARAARPAARIPAATASPPRPCTAASGRARACTPSTAWWMPTTSPRWRRAFPWAATPSPTSGAASPSGAACRARPTKVSARAASIWRTCPCWPTPWAPSAVPSAIPPALWWMNGRASA